MSGFSFRKNFTNSDIKETKILQLSTTVTNFEIRDNVVPHKENSKYTHIWESKIRPFPHVIRSVDPEINEDLLKHFSGEKTGYVQVGSKKWFFPSKYKYEAANLYNFALREDDVFVVTFPRSGTTWTQEMVWLLSNNLDYETASNVPLTDRFPFFEFNIFVHDQVKQEFLNENSHDEKNMALIENMAEPAWKYLEGTKQRRFIKTHLPFSLLPPDILEKGCKVIYVARNPKDVAVSFYHLNRSIRTQGYLGDFPKYWDYFERNLQPWTPYWEHVTEGWSRRHNPNLLFMFYEDINENLKKCIQKVQTFLGECYSEEDITKLEDHLKIDRFKHNKSVNNDLLKKLGMYRDSEQGFVRNGKIGGWRQYFSPELNERANKWILENLKSTDIVFPNQSELLL